MKSEGAGNRERMLRLSMMASKFGFFLLAIFAIPCIFEMESILQFWLKDVPEYTVVFCQLILIGTLANQLTIGLQSAMQASGDIRWYQILVGSTLLLNLPLAYLLLKLNYPPFSVLVSYIFIELLACFFRLVIAKRILGLHLSTYASAVFFKEVGPVLLSCVSCYLVWQYMSGSYRFVFTGVLSTSVFLISIYFVGLIQPEKQLVLQLVQKVKSKRAS